MKWIFYAIVFVYMFYRAVYGQKYVENGVRIDPVTYQGFVRVGASEKITCKASNKNQKLEWQDPNGSLIKSNPSGRIFSQERFLKVYRGRAPVLDLTVNKAAVQDAGVYKCRSGNIVKNFTLCVIDPSEFINTSAEVTTDLGRSITLSCQARGDPEPRLEWIRNGDIIDDDNDKSKYRIMTKYNIQGYEGLLTIMSLEPEDAGIYSCRSVQDNIQAYDCSYTDTFNITLNINYAPVFESGNTTEFVYGRHNQQVEIECSTPGYPVPTYRWFREEGDELSEYDKKDINLIEDENKAILLIDANPSTFEKRFKCEASNEHGSSYKYFVLMEMDKPRKPSKIKPFNETENSVDINVTWNEETQYPVSAFDVQYKKKDGRSTVRPSWKGSRITEIPLEDPVDPGLDGITFTLPDLGEETSYWVRVQAKNEVGESPWSDPISIITTPHLEATTTKASESAEASSNNHDSKPDEIPFYAFFFAGGVFLFSMGFMFATRYF